MLFGLHLPAPAWTFNRKIKSTLFHWLRATSYNGWVANQHTQLARVQSRLKNSNMLTWLTVTEVRLGLLPFTHLLKANSSTGQFVKGWKYLEFKLAKWCQQIFYDDCKTGDHTFNGCLWCGNTDYMSPWVKPTETKWTQQTIVQTLARAAISAGVTF